MYSSSSPSAMFSHKWWQELNEVFRN
uniref:Uncharacterized protein n=1 Tax=Arundo donax TaxID=35708 RepID=A0A0A9BZM7_ARUDO